MTTEVVIGAGGEEVIVPTDTNAFALATDPDAILDARRDSFACAACGSPDPARLYDGGCSDCRETAARCVLCRRWVDVHGGPPSINAMFDGRIRAMCSYCEDRTYVEDEAP